MGSTNKRCVFSLLCETNADLEPQTAILLQYYHYAILTWCHILLLSPWWSWARPSPRGSCGCWMPPARRSPGWDAIGASASIDNQNYLGKLRLFRLTELFRKPCRPSRVSFSYMPDSNRRLLTQLPDPGTFHFILSTKLTHPRTT